MFLNGINELKLPVCKKLSRDEITYIKILNNGVDENIQYTIKWLNTPEAKSILKADDEDEFEDEFFNSILYENLNKIFHKNVLNGNGIIKKFYDVGLKLGYKDIGKKLPFLHNDNQALLILSNHIGSVTLNVNQEVGIGIKDVLMLGVLGGIGVSKLSENLLKVPYTPIRSNISVSSRCTLIGRTEYSRAINTGTLQAYSNSGVSEVDIITTGLPNVCDDCLDLESNNPYTVEEAMKILPLHPQCACSYEPVKSSIGDGEPIIVDLT